jgi:hypothetical protein
MARESWTRGSLQVRKTMSGQPRARLGQTGGADFINRLAALMFDIKLNRAQNNIKAMRENFGNPDLVEGLAGGFFSALGDVKGEIPGLEGATWQHSNFQMAKLFYREAAVAGL